MKENGAVLVNVPSGPGILLTRFSGFMQTQTPQPQNRCRYRSSLSSKSKLVVQILSVGIETNPALMLEVRFENSLCTRRSKTAPVDAMRVEAITCRFNASHWLGLHGPGAPDQGDQADVDVGLLGLDGNCFQFIKQWVHLLGDGIRLDLQLL